MSLDPTRRGVLASAAAAVLPRVAAGQPARPTVTVAVQNIANTVLPGLSARGYGAA